mmetsp:Transcript_7085/g.29312  ORF Transcript_7085/g.29312 Transcript_7085/m.29312 type:complete len:266 (+) Transcript_7085:2109-2906(+)
MVEPLGRRQRGEQLHVFQLALAALIVPQEHLVDDLGGGRDVELVHRHLKLVLIDAAAPVAVKVLEPRPRPPETLLQRQSLLPQELLELVHGVHLWHVPRVPRLGAVEEIWLVEVLERRGDLVPVVPRPSVGAIRSPPLDDAAASRLHLFRGRHDGACERLDVHLAVRATVRVLGNELGEIRVGGIDVDAEERLAKARGGERAVVVGVEKSKEVLRVFGSRVAPVGVSQVVEHRRLDPAHGERVVPAAGFVQVQLGAVPAGPRARG